MPSKELLEKLSKRACQRYSSVVCSMGLFMAVIQNIIAAPAIVTNQSELDSAVNSAANPIDVVSGGTMTLNGDFANNTDLSIAHGVELIVNSNQTIGSLSGNGALTVGTNSLVVGGNNLSTAFSGTINLESEAWLSPYGTFIKVGSGALTINGATITNGEAFVNQGSMLQTSGTTLINYLGVGSGTEGNGTFDISGGTLNIRTTLQVGDWGGLGVLNQTGGDVILMQTGCGDASRCTSLNIGNQGGSGTYNISGGTLVLTARNVIGRSTGSNPASTGILNISGGLVNLAPEGDNTASIILGEGNNSQGIITQTGGVLRLGNNSNLYLSTTTGTTGIYNLNGGVLETGGNRFQGRYNNSTSLYEFNFGGGTIKVIDEALISSVDATLMSGTVSTIDTNNFNAQWNGTLSGNGGFAKDGFGVLTQNGQASYLGKTFINAGTFMAGGANVLASNSAFTIASNATLDLNNYDNVIGSLAGSGSLLLGSATLTHGSDGSSTNFSGSINGSGGLIKEGVGTLTLSGDGASFTGITELNLGELVINTTLGGNLITESSTVLRGTGTLGGLGSTATINGSIQPGSTSVGTLVFNGNYVQESSSVYNMEILNPSQYNVIHVAGTATINDSIVNLRDQGIFPVNKTLSILHADGGVSGQYSTLQATSRPFLDFALSYGNNDVYLSIMRTSTVLTDFALTPNQISVANALESFSFLNQSDPLYLAVLNITDPLLLPSVFNSLSGQIHTAALGAYVEESRYLRDAVLNRLEFLHDGLPVSRNRTHWWSESGFWMEGYGAWGHMNTPSNNTASLKRKNSGLFIGLDTPIYNRLRTGVVAGFGKTSLDMPALNSNGNSDNAYVGLYTSAQAKKLTGYLGAAYAWHHLDTNRFVAFPGVSDFLRASYQVPFKQIFTEAGYDLYSNASYKFKPFVQAAYVDVSSSSFNEYGGISALTGAKKTDEVFYSTVGVRMNAGLGNYQSVSWKIRGLLGWQHAYHSISPISSFAFIGGSSPFLISGVPIARNAALIDAALDMGAYNDNLHIILGYLSQLSGRVQDNGIQGTINYRFS